MYLEDIGVIFRDWFAWQLQDLKEAAAVAAKPLTSTISVCVCVV